MLQNSLDALELRDLRLQLKAKGGKPFAPVDSLDGHELAATLSWGEQDGTQFLRVEDNGTGMTLQTIERYFTQIGKSFYKSPDFSAEQAELLRHRLISTPISQFGIGILSCFMIADRLSVRTNPGGGQEATDLEISGPGSLFWTRPGTRNSQGTEVTLWLRSAHRIPMEHDREKVFTWLRDAFRYRGGRKPNDDARRDPGFIAARHVVWPKYPVYVQPPGKGGWTIDDRLHIDRLAPIDPKAFRGKLREWDYPIQDGNDPRWSTLNWTDDQGDAQSGTRVRIWYPAQPVPELEAWELAAFVGPQAQQTLPVLLSQSMAIENVDAIRSCLPLRPEPGYRVWIDLRGRVAPSLTADRKTARAQGLDAALCAWASLASACEGRSETRQSVLWSRGLLFSPRDRPVRTAAWFCGGKEQQRLTAAALSATLALDLARDLDRDRDLARDIALARDLARALARDLALDLDLDLALTRDLDLARALARARDLAPDLARDLDLAFARAPERLELHSSFLQEAFFPDLPNSWPPLGLRGLDGKIGDATLTAPARIAFDLAGRCVQFSDPSGELPALLARFGYDLCFPISAIPLGRVRRDFPNWREDRRYRPLGILPLLLPAGVAPWANHVATLVHIFAPITSLYAFQPAESLWFKPFADWTADDIQNPDHKSIFWNIATGRVSRRKGMRPRPVE